MTDFYKDKKVTVIGGAGFFGYHLVKRLVKLGAKVTVIDSMRRGHNTVDHSSINYLDLDIVNNFELCKIAIKDSFAMFNFAAKVAGVIYNQQNQLQMLTDNINCQFKPLLLASENDIPHFMQVSSVCIYPDNETNPCDDSLSLDDMRPANSANAGYAQAKRLGELAVSYSTLEHAVIARPSNLYGPLDYFDDKTSHVIPALIKKCLNDDIIEVYGTGEEIREFLYVGDAVDGLLKLMEFGDHKQAYNLGTNGRTKISIRELLAIIQKLTGTRNKTVVFSSEFNSGDNVRWSDCAKLEKVTNWKAETTMRDGLHVAIEWYKGAR